MQDHLPAVKQRGYVSLVCKMNSPLFSAKERGVLHYVARGFPVD